MSEETQLIVFVTICITGFLVAVIELRRRSAKPAPKPAPAQEKPAAKPWPLIEVDNKQVRPLLAQLKDGRHVLAFERAGPEFVGLRVGATVPNEKIVACITFTSVEAIAETRKMLLVTQHDLAADAELIRIGALRPTARHVEPGEATP